MLKKINANKLLIYCEPNAAAPVTVSPPIPAADRRAHPHRVVDPGAAVQNEKAIFIGVIIA
jgi:hypothetical protein